MDALNLRYTTRWSVAVVAMAIAASGCSLDKQEMPPLSGPSGLGLSITMAASPDQLPRDGTSQSIVTLTARNSNGQPINGEQLSLRLSTGSPAGASITQSTVTTNSSGQATFTVIAPNAGTIGDIAVLATPVGTDANNATSSTITIKALPQNNTAPNAQFTVAPTTPEVGQLTTFDASATTDEGSLVCNNRCSFAWNFGDNTTASGPIVTHTFSVAGTYVVGLTVTDVAGTTGLKQTSVTVTAHTIPTQLKLTAEINPPVAGQPDTYTASATPAPNHNIVSYSINWGDGTSNFLASSTPSVQHTFAQAQIYLVTLTATDDLGQVSTLNTTFTPTSGLTASFTFSPSSPSADQDVTFDASASSSQVASTISSYTWDFGDGHSATTSSPTIIYGYSASGTYTVKLTITDNHGVKASTTQSITVK